MNKLLSGLNSHDSLTHNGAVTHSTSGSALLDYFAKSGTYRGRDEVVVASDMASIFGEDEQLALKSVLYNRMVTRKVQGFHATDVIQKGQGNKDEFIRSLKWLEVNQPKLLYKNLALVVSVGKWSDLWYDSPVTKLYHYVKFEEVAKLVKKGLKSKYHRALLAKLLPKIRSSSNVKNDRHRRLNDFARNLYVSLGWSEQEYRKFKSNPENNAHLWQRQACANEWDEIDFNLVPGKALFSLVSRKGRDKKNAIERHNLEAAYLKWIESQPVAKFSGYPYELFVAAKKGRTTVQTYTYNKQFEKLLENAKDNVNPELLSKGVLCALDTSGSMGSMNYYGGGNQNMVQPIDIAVGLGIFFSSLLQGSFKDHVALFDSSSRLIQVKGNFCDKVDQMKHHANAMGGTNFQSLIDMLVNFRRNNPNVPLSDYPKVLLVVSDMQFDPSGGYSWNRARKIVDTKTNYEEAMSKLAAVGLGKMSLVWWNVNGYGNKDVPNKMDDEGVVLISGFDPAIASAVLKGTEMTVDKETGIQRQKTPYEVMIECLDQEILNQVKV
jgi:hypothetical protein